METVTQRTETLYMQTRDLVAKMEQERVMLPKVKCDEHGDIEFTYEDDRITKVFYPQYNRTFKIYNDNLIVEHIPQPVDLPKPEPIPDFETKALRKMIKDGQYPKVLGGTVVVPYYDGGMVRREAYLTKTHRGVVADFIEAGVQLFCFSGNKKIARYSDLHTSTKEREARKKERARMEEDSKDVVYQMGYDGTPEPIDRSMYKIKVECPCGNVRWVKKCDKGQVVMCKPCIRKKKRNWRRNHKRAESKTY